MTEKQVWARKRNWLIMRLEGASSIFSDDNSFFLENTLKENSFCMDECKAAIDELLFYLRKSCYQSKFAFDQRNRK